MPENLLTLNIYRFTRRFDREMSIFSTDSGVSVNTNQISAPTTPDSSYTTDSSNKQSMIIVINKIIKIENIFSQ